MKNSVLLITLLTAMSLSAQGFREGYNNHEFRFNMGRFLSSATIEGSYEYYFTPDTSTLE